MDLVQRRKLGPHREWPLIGSDHSDSWLADLLGVQPRDIALYYQALTHGSTGETLDYQRLEFLGDRVLGLAIAEWLYQRFPQEPEGMLSQRLNRLVSRERCAEAARIAGVGPHIRLGKQASDDGARDSVNILGDVIEALIGACFIDHGMDAARGLIRRLWSSLLDADAAPAKHPKSALQEWTAGNRRKPPEYRVIDRSGPDHAARFVIEVTVAKVGAAQAEGSSKQEAETAAAAAFMQRYG